MENNTIKRVERIDDVPVLLAQMERIGLPDLLNEHFPTHGNWRGLSIGHTIMIWLAYIISESDHRLSYVESWAGELQMSLESILGEPVRALDFSDDRLALILNYMSDNKNWEATEISLNQNSIRAYDLDPVCARIDSTTAKGYFEVTEDGLFQFGHSKDHRPDLPQVKINISVLDPLGLPLTTSIVQGNDADDPLYVPEIKKIQKNIGDKNKIYIGDCKMGAVETRAYIAGGNNFYLCPLSGVAMPKEKIDELLEAVWEGDQELEPVYAADGEKIKIAEGFEYKEEITAKTEERTVTWEERRMVVRSVKHAEKQKAALYSRLEKAQNKIEALNIRGRGRKRYDNIEEVAEKVNKIEKEYNVEGLFDINYEVKSETYTKRRYKDRPEQTITKRDVKVLVKKNNDAIEKEVRGFGWRVYVSNSNELSLEKAIMAYRAEYIVEKSFERLKGKSLSLSPLYLNSDERITGLIRLLTIALRILSLLEFAVRSNLERTNEKLAGIYAGNPKRSTSRPTAEMMLRAFRGISVVFVNINGKIQAILTPLKGVQKRILKLLNTPYSVYLSLEGG